MTINWSEIPYNLLGIILILVLPIVTFYVVKYLKTLRDEISLRSDSEYFQGTIDQVFHIITTAVLSTSQTYVDSLKAEGKFDEEAHTVAFNKTKDTVLNLLTDEMKELISVTYSDLNTWLDTEIEATVKDVKSIN